MSEKVVRPIGGKELTIQESEMALRKAMEIIEKVGTTGIYDVEVTAEKWMKEYFPLYQ